MSVPTMLLLTEHFPYGSAEPFLETELPYLAQHFDVHLLPTSALPTEFSQRRDVPDNVSVLEGVSRELLYSFRSWSALLFRKPLIVLRILRLMLQEWRRVPRYVWAFRRLIRFSTQAVLVADQLLNADSLPEFDIYYSYWLFSNALSIVLCREAGREAHFIARAHRGDLYTCLAEREYQPFRQRTIGKLDRVICISDHGRRYLARQFPSQEERFEVSRHVVVAPPSRSRPGDDEALHVVSCSHLSPVKRVDLLLDSLSRLKIPVVWTHLGGGVLESAIRGQARTLPGHIIWHITGRVSNEEVLSYFQTERVDVFVNVSRSEGLPVSIMEALSCGVPVIATDVGGTSELVNDTNGSLLPKETDAKGVAGALERFHALSAEEKQAKRDAAWQTWSSEADASKQYTEFSLWLQALCSCS